MLLQEQTHRRDRGLPHTTFNDIMNDWVLEQGLKAGHKPLDPKSKS